MPVLDDRSTRRAFLVSGVATATLLGTGASAFARGAACALTPEQEEGPFYLPASQTRSNLGLGHPGIPLALEFRVVDVATCAPIPLATVDIWHCDAMGIYSGFGELRGGPGGPPQGGFPVGMHGVPPHFGPPPHGGMPPHGMPPKAKPSNSARFLRGVAATGRDGVARFDTIFPGFYQGRVNHVHMKVRVAGASRVVHTGQLFFPEAIASKVSSETPYSAHKIQRTTLAEDGVYGGQHGGYGMSDVRTTGSGENTSYLARLTLVVDKNATPRPVHMF